MKSRFRRDVVFRESIQNRFPLPVRADKRERRFINGFLSYTTFSKDIFAFFVQISFEIVFLNIVFPESFTVVSRATAPISTALIFSAFRTFTSFFTSFVTTDNALSKNALTSILRFLRSIAAPCFNTFLRASQAQIRSFTSGLSKTRRSFQTLRARFSRHQTQG